VLSVHPDKVEEHQIRPNLSEFPKSNLKTLGPNELISPAYLPCDNVFLSQQNSISWLISHRNHQPNNT